MARGVRQQPLFRMDDDYELFKMLLEDAMSRFTFQILSYVLMTNHFHVLIKTEETEIGKIMNRILSSYARTFNGKYGYSGHVFDSRYVSKLVEDNRYLLEVSRYIHLNPVKARMVRDPAEYRYSSYECFAGNRIEDLVTTDPVLNLFQNDPCGQYRRFVLDSISHREMECLIQHDMKEDENWLPW